MQSSVVIRYVASASSEGRLAPAAAKLVGTFSTGFAVFLIERGHPRVWRLRNEIMSEGVNPTPSVVERREIWASSHRLSATCGPEVRTTNVGGVFDLSATLGEQS